MRSADSRAIRQSVKCSPYPLAIVDKEFRYIATSDAWRKTYGLEEKEIIGKNHYDFFPEIKERKEWLDVHQRALQGETIDNQRDKFVRDDGSVMYLEWVVTPWYTDDKEKSVGGVIMHTKDITSKILFEQKIKQLNIDLENKIRERTRELELANQSLESFSYSVSHDLRAPLRAIDGFSQILKEEYSEKLDEEGNRILGVIQKNATKMGKLIDDILEFSRTGRTGVEDELIDMNWLTEQVMSEVSSEYQNKQVETLVDDLPEIKGSLVMIRQLMENLISNAFKYSSKNEEIKVEVGSKNAPGSGYHTFFVKDNGIGLDMKYKEKVFGVFERLHTEKTYQGTGVGLAIAKKIVHMHKGKIWVSSEENKGTSFYFTIPQTKPTYDQT